jgi:hypothetical protein
MSITPQYSDMTTAERRSHGAKQAAKTRARNKMADTYAAKFGRVYGVQDAKLDRQMTTALETGVDIPELVERKREHNEHAAEYDRKRAEFLATPIPAETDYTTMIKQRRLYEGACMLAWEMYFKFREDHPDEVER